jgi:hypothetical protein
MPELEIRIQRWVEHRNEGVGPVGLDEIRERAANPVLPLDGHRPRASARARVLAVAAVVVLIALVASSAWMLNRPHTTDVVSDPDPTGPVDDPVETTMDRFVPLLPTEGHDHATVVDLEASRRSTGITRPAADSTPDEVDAYLEAVTERAMRGVALPAVVVSTFDDSGEERTARTRQHLGFDAAQILSWAEWGSFADNVVVIHGEFDIEAIEAAARSRSTPIPVDERQHRDITYFSWVPDRSDRSTPYPGNPTGGEQHLAVVDDLVLVATESSEIERLVDLVLDHGDDPAPRNELGHGLATGIAEMQHSGPAWDITAFSSEMGSDVQFMAWAGVRAQPGSGGYDGATFAVYEFETDDLAATAPDRLDDALAAMSDRLSADEIDLLREHTELEVESTRVTLRLLPEAWSGDRTSAFAFEDLAREMLR